MPGVSALLPRKTGGKVRHNINRIASNNHNGGWSSFQDFWNDGSEDCCIAVEQFEARFAGTLIYTGGEEDHTRTDDIAIIAGFNVNRMGKGNGMADVICLSLGAV